MRPSTFQPYGTVSTIHKYELEITDEQTIKMPRNAVFLSAQMQGNKPCIWCWVDPDGEMEDVTFRIFGTGHAIDRSRYPGLRYWATVQTLHGNRSGVWHIFSRDVIATSGK